MDTDDNNCDSKGKKKVENQPTPAYVATTLTLTLVLTLTPSRTHSLSHSHARLQRLLNCCMGTLWRKGKTTKRAHTKKRVWDTDYYNCCYCCCHVVELTFNQFFLFLSVSLDIRHTKEEKEEQQESSTGGWRYNSTFFEQFRGILIVSTTTIMFLALLLLCCYLNCGILFSLTQLFFL